MSSALEPLRTSPIPGWKIDSSKLAASMKWHPSWLVFFVFAACWNLVMLRVWAASGKPMVPIFAIASDVAAAAFALLAVRAALARTIVRFDARELTVLAPLAPWNNTRIDL
ncbi:MAG: hypothetical protein ABI461_21620, partial [Polyangiaceae bacterium]